MLHLAKAKLGAVSPRHPEEVVLAADTVVALGVGARCDENGDENTIAPVLEKLGYKLERAKTNIGLGRITNAAAPRAPEKSEESVSAK